MLSIVSDVGQRLLFFTFCCMHCTAFIICIILLFECLGDPRITALKRQEVGTETESIRTEDFETAFQKSLPAGKSETKSQRR